MTALFIAVMLGTPVLLRKLNQSNTTALAGEGEEIMKEFCSAPRAPRLGMSSVLLLAISGGAMAQSPTEVAPWDSGNATVECGRISGDYPYACKIDSWSASVTGQSCPNGEGGDNTITISNNNDGTHFSWTATESIGAVIVKGGNAANVFYYNPQASSDTRLYSPNNPSGTPAAVSHATFCWNPEGGEFECAEETAWAYGAPYNADDQGNWSTYHIYEGMAIVKLYAGQDMEAGEVTFSDSDSDQVTITIILYEGWSFNNELDKKGNQDHNVKVQGYAGEPSGNPAPGEFEHKDIAESSPFSITVPRNSYYGVHVDVKQCTLTNDS